jgi:predicted DCC family thiol-disulfide oxidoreductase YuxK
VRPTLVFDGGCGFCTRTLGWLRVIDGRRRLETVPYQRPGVPESVGATERECATELQFQGTDGRRLSGAAAANGALGVALRSRWPLAVYARTAFVQDRAYRWVAEHRHRLPGVRPWCDRYPDDCGDRPAEPPNSPTGG